jgi:Tfp pilus assembly protein PilV
MKAKSITKNQAGFSTLEILIALALVILTISAITLVGFGSQSVAADSQTNTEALHKAQEILDNALETSRNSFDSVVTTVSTYTNGIIYNTLLDIPIGAKCLKSATSTVSWMGDHKRQQNVTLKTQLTNVPEMLALGGNCDTVPPPAIGWNPPDTWASSNFNPGKPTGLDALNRIVYMTGDKTPFLFIADTNGVAKGVSSGLFINFSNGFDDRAQLNDVKVARLSDGKIYAFVARDTSTNQFEIINVNDIHNPVSVAKRSLAGVSGSAPQGWRLYYYNNYVYIVARFTAGPELHIFNVNNPSSPTEITINGGLGFDLGRTVESMVVAKKTISAVDHFFLFTATDKDSAELSVFDTTYSAPNVAVLTEVVAADQNLPGFQDGSSVFYNNGYLYFGRTSTPSGSDLYIFDAHDPSASLPLMQQRDIGTGAIGIVVSGPFTFVATSKTNSEFQVWTSNPLQPITQVNTTNFNFPNIISNGIKYENDWVYVASQGNDALRIIYNNP